MLEFAEGEHGELSGASTWVAVNGDPSKLPGQIKAAEGAGVKRALIHVAADAETAGIVSSLEASSLTYTLMRTGELTKAGEGGGLILEEVRPPPRTRQGGLLERTLACSQLGSDGQQ